MNKTILCGLLLCLFGAAGKGYGQELTTGLVASYPFNGNANDESGNNCEVNGATLTDDEAVGLYRSTFPQARWQDV